MKFDPEEAKRLAEDLWPFESRCEKAADMLRAAVERVQAAEDVLRVARDFLATPLFNPDYEAGIRLAYALQEYDQLHNSGSSHA